MTEMLLQCYEGLITLLPALPAEWVNGEISGIKARGGFKVDLAWNSGALSSGKIYSGLGGNCRIRTKIPVKVVEVSSKPGVGSNHNPFYQLNPLVKVEK